MDKEKHLALIRQHFALSVAADSENRANSLLDQAFVFGGDAQWDKEAQQARKGRPMLTANKMPKFVRQVTGSQRQNKPAAKVHPVDSSSDITIAKIIEGHIKNIEYNSDASQSYDEAFKQAVTGGYPGWWRVTTEYAEDDAFDQDIFIRPIHNQYSVYADPETILDVYQGKLAWCFVTETMTEESFKAQFPNKDQTNWEQGTGEDYEGWWMDGMVRVAEYFYREPVKSVIYQLEDGSVIAADKVKQFITKGPDGKLALMTPDGQGIIKIKKERTVDSHKLMWCKVGGGTEYLEEPRELPGRIIPVIPVFGDTWVLNGKVLYKSAIRDGKDPQRAYNYVWSQSIEMAALAPKVPFKLTAKQIAGHEKQWNALNQTPMPYVLYNVDPQAPAPQREAGAQVNPAFVQLSQQANIDIEDTIGIYKSAYGAASNDVSGVAQRERKQGSDVNSFEFVDNLTRALTHTYKIIVDLIPKIYDGERTIRTLGADDTPQQVSINKTIAGPNGEQVIINDMTVGKYDVRVSVGPSFATQRTENAVAMQAIVQAAPNTAPVIVPEWVRMQDWPNAQEISQKLEQMNQPHEPQGQAEMLQLQIDKLRNEIMESETRGIKNLADAEAKMVGQQITLYQQQAESMRPQGQGQPGQAPQQMPQMGPTDQPAPMMPQTLPPGIRPPA